MTMHAHALERTDTIEDCLLQPVLIVDDEIMLAEELGEAMASHGYRCFIADTEQLALKLIVQNPEIETVVVDFYLRGAGVSFRNGLDVVERLRTIVPERNLDCVVISGDPDIVAECTMCGVTKFLPKPVHPECLSAMLRQRVHSPTDSDREIVSLLQRRLVQQSAAIGKLAQRVSSDRNDGQGLSRNIDRIVSAACIMREMAGQQDEPMLQNIAQYIVDVSATVKAEGPAQSTAEERPLGPLALS